MKLFSFQMNKRAHEANVLYNFLQTLQAEESPGSHILCLALTLLLRRTASCVNVDSRIAITKDTGIYCIHILSRIYCRHIRTHCIYMFLRTYYIRIHLRTYIYTHFLFIALCIYNNTAINDALIAYKIIKKGLRTAKYRMMYL